MISSLDKNLEILRNHSEISEEDIKQIVQNLPDSKIWEYMSHKFTSINPDKSPEAIKNFVDAYQLIRDDSWPSVLTLIEDFYNLPDPIQQECATVHRYHPDIWFNPNITFDQWAPSNTVIPVDDLIRLHYVLYKNHDLIKGKKIIDFPCHYGNLSFFLANMEVKHLTLAEVRSAALDIAVECMQLLKIPSTEWTATQADLHNLANNTKICQGHDTVICAGVLYHIHDHLDVLESIVKSRVKNIIIESEEYLPIKDLKEPLIHWSTEMTESWCEGWHNDKTQVFVGHPNTAWLDMAMNFLGCQKAKPTEFYTLYHWDASMHRSVRHRSVHVYTNKNTQW